MVKEYISTRGSKTKINIHIARGMIIKLITSQGSAITASTGIKSICFPLLTYLKLWGYDMKFPQALH